MHKIIMKETQLTFSPNGHFLNNFQCFSLDGKWLVYDIRNHDADIGKTGSIEMVNTETGEVKVLYRVQNQTGFGPGVGAAAFSPVANRVVFIHGIRNASEANPYGFSRRTGVAIDINAPGQPIFMDARNVNAPFIRGALRGGTHAHSWSGDGQWLSFTYNDDVVAKLGKLNPEIQDLRTVGVMLPRKVGVIADGDAEHNNGEMYSVIITEVTEQPPYGSNEIDKAFDECWVGSNGYLKANGNWQKKAVAFQGNIRTREGKTKTEVFIVDLPAELPENLSEGQWPEMTAGRLPVPEGITQKRLSYTENGVLGPRHWLRSSPDGAQIAFLSKDTGGFINVFAVSPNGGEVRQLSFHLFHIQSGFNFSPDGKWIAYIAKNAVYITETRTGSSEQLTYSASEAEKPVGSVNWSPDGKLLAYNRYVNNYLQVFLLSR